MSDLESQAATACAAAVEPATKRRSVLLTAVMGFLGTALLAIPTAISGVLFLDPLLKKKSGSDVNSDDKLNGFIKLPLSAESIPSDGSPVAVTVRTDKDDAWNRFRDVPVGSVWVRRTDQGIQVFNSVCPHLGCAVDFRSSERDFRCPCHAATFALDGQKQNQVSPRNMDSLESVLVADGKITDDGEEIWVLFQNFARGTSEKNPI